MKQEGMSYLKQEIKLLEQDIQQKEKQIETLQSACQHTLIRKREFPDINAGWGGSESCELCDKFLNCWTRMKMPKDKPRDYTEAAKR